MKYFYEFVKTIYFVMTIFVGVFFLRGEIFFPKNYSEIIIYLLPAYLILCGLMIGYIIAQIRQSLYDNIDIDRNNSILLKSFIIGIITGFVLALLSVFL